jgi:phosphoribosylaminoimidazolecarboxamide formyltransferase/IMP cyclohydrolase
MPRCERALLSVHDKTGVVELARALAELNVEILSTGGTARLLRENGVKLRDVSEVTGSPEMLGGRVKTLHPAIHAGILARRDDPHHLEELRRHSISPIDLVVVNLYPFAATAARAEAMPAELVEEIDIGGPTMLRAAAKNFAAVAVVVSPQDYGRVIEELRARGEVSLEMRLELARKVFATTAAYDATIASTLEELRLGDTGLERAVAGAFPALLPTHARKAMDLRYGENPHQRAALYRTGDRAAGIAGAKQLQGKELSYNNLLDLDAAWELAREFEQPVCAIIKHTNPCGVAIARPEGSGQDEAYARAYACDPVSAFGCVLAFNRPLAATTAEAMGKHFVEAIAAPGYEVPALAALEKKKNLRLLEVTGAGTDCWRARSISGGLLVQDADVSKFDFGRLRAVTARQPTAAEMEALLFAWVVCKHAKSNAIVYAREGRTVGIGAGQMSRVDSVKLGAMKARELGHADALKGSVVASDAFFPFPDGVEEAARAGATAVIQPGGSVRDEEVIASANRLGLAMVLTGIRHFRH